jgi:hypothetical protein
MAPEQRRLEETSVDSESISRTLQENRALGL